MKEITLLHFVGSTNTEIDALTPQEVHKLTPVNDKNVKPHFMVDFYDDEFCLNSTLFCDSIEFETKEVENI
jgi:hypothetical protein